MKHKLLFPCLCCLFCVKLGFGQEPTGTAEEKETKKGQHQLTLIISHSHVTEGVDENGDKKWIVVPSWGFDYNYWIGAHWAAGLHTDIMIEDFSVKEHGEDDKTIERTKPFAAVAAATFKPKEHSAFILGMGGEFAKGGNFALTRLGYEYGWELRKRWELSAGLTYDIKWNAYDTWVIGLGASKFFGGK